ncbi:MAG: sulfite exporter TauE/SafE family protein [bacterium]|nr:sulfite exporter TauE/SafE family protein [bacterium]
MHRYTYTEGIGRRWAEQAPISSYPTAVEALLTPSILFVAAVVQGFLGFGFGIIAMSGLSLTVGVWFAAGVVNLAGFVQTSSGAWALRDHIRWPLVRRVLMGTVFGVATGLWLFQQLDLRLLQRLLGVVIVAIAGWNLSPWRPKPAESPQWDIPAGAMSGLLNGLFNTGGPPLVAHIYRYPGSPESLKATLYVLLLCTVSIRIPGAWSQGMFPSEVWRAAALSVVPVLVGSLLGIALARRIDPMRFRRLSWVALGGLGFWIAYVS